jgi:hypothetical protein
MKTHPDKTQTELAQLWDGQISEVDPMVRTDIAGN